MDINELIKKYPVINYSRIDYEKLIYCQTHLQFEGLFFSDYRCVAICANYDENNTLTNTGDMLLSHWLNENRIIGSPIYISNIIPQNSIKIPERTIDEISLYHGVPLTIRDIQNELELSLPENFPLFEVNSKPPHHLIFYTEQLLSDEDKTLVEITCENVKCNMTVLFQNKELILSRETNSKAESFLESFTILELKNSKNLRSKTAYTTRKILEADEDFWLDNRKILFTENHLDPFTYLTETFQADNTSCFINALSALPNNIRNYLSIYQRVIIALPPDDTINPLLLALQISEKDLIQLAQKNRVQFILPLSIQRYDQDFINKICDEAPHSILLSRRLAAATVASIRARIPLLFPTTSVIERQQLLSLLKTANVQFQNPILSAVIAKLGDCWIGSEFDIHSRGAIAVSQYGLSPIIAEIFRQKHGDNRLLEILATSMSVEWSSALGATYFPAETTNYSELKIAELCASMYSGITQDSAIQLSNDMPKINKLLDGLLTVNNDCPVIEFADAFDRPVTKIFLDLIQQATDVEELEELIIKINKQITSYETRKEKINSYDIFGYIAAFSATTLSGLPPTITPAIPLLMWILQSIIKHNDSFGQLGDYLRSTITYSHKNTILISKLKNKINS